MCLAVDLNLQIIWGSFGLHEYALGFLLPDVGSFQAIICLLTFSVAFSFSSPSEFYSSGDYK